MGYYRFLENENVKLSELVRSLSDDCQLRVGERHVLAISDSSEINLQSHVGRLSPSGLGVVGNNTDVGFYIHPTLVLDGESGFPLGLSTVKLWSRDINHADKHEPDYKNLPIEEKESYKWLASAESSQRCFEVGGAKMVTHIGDAYGGLRLRESDLFEEFATIPNKNNHLLIRACQDRRLLGRSQSLFDYLSQQPCEGTYIINVPADPRYLRVAREAMLIVGCGRVEIQRPDKLSVFGYPLSVTLFAVEALEVQPPVGQEPIHWRLLTTHEVVCLEQALRVIQWYGWRWKIEQLFATLKKAGLNLEATQLESSIAIQRLTILALSVAVRTLQMVEGRDNTQLSAELTFCEKQQQCLSVIQTSVESDTKKLQNPYPRGCLPWATWIIARLGGWSGYTSGRPPGMPTLVHGLRQFESIFLGWKLALGGLVYTR